MKALELLKIFADPGYEASYVNAKVKGTCILCGEKADRFRDASARLEYKVSALCQCCQDRYFSGKAVP